MKPDLPMRHSNPAGSDGRPSRTTGIASPPRQPGSVHGYLRGLFHLGLTRFVLIGGLSAALSISLLYVAVDLLGIPYLLAFAAIFIGINTVAYLASRRMVFASTRVGLHSGLLRYFGVSGVSLAMNSLALVLLVEYAGLRPVPASILLSLANAPLSYLLHGRVTFLLRHQSVGREHRGEQ
ncbi:GtrA family protein [Thermomonas flagellata]|uniref:GtrA family protein n=1 Tax=Thermomonas flagellata TaxID=2888524 RepID=UPI001F042F67|nr:GtrA family protein [Thermomonas flagellata]